MAASTAPALAMGPSEPICFRASPSTTSPAAASVALMFPSWNSFASIEKSSTTPPMLPDSDSLKSASCCCRLSMRCSCSSLKSSSILPRSASSLLRSCFFGRPTSSAALTLMGDSRTITSSRLFLKPSTCFSWLVRSSFFARSSSALIFCHRLPMRLSTCSIVCSVSVMLLVLPPPPLLPPPLLPPLFFPSPTTSFTLGVVFRMVL